jgi:1-acyl-sn-glycerol-3-phosphate acyltransferase
MKRCIEVLKSGQPLVLFPEGERKDGPTVHPLLDGAAFLAAKAGVPLVPVGIGGSDKAMPRRAKFVYPRKVVVIIGEPIFVETNDAGRSTRENLTEATDRLHSEIQRLYDQAVAKAS